MGRVCERHLVLCAAQLGWPDMRLPILYTMSWPARVPCSEATWPRLDFAQASQLTFRPPDRQKYPSMDLAYSAGRCERPFPRFAANRVPGIHTPDPRPFRRVLLVASAGPCMPVNAVCACRCLPQCMQLVI